MSAYNHIHMYFEQEKAFLFSWRDTIISASLFTFTTVLCLLLFDFFADNNDVVMIYVLMVVVLSSVTSGYLYGILASALSVIAVNYFFTYPYWELDFTRSGYPVTFFSILVVSVITSTLTVRARTQTHLAIAREYRTDILYTMNKQLMSTSGLENIVLVSSEYVSKLFCCAVVFYTDDPNEENCAVCRYDYAGQFAAEMDSEEELKAAKFAYQTQQNTGAGTKIYSGASGFYMPIISQDKVVSVVGLFAKDNLFENKDNQNFLIMMLSQTALAIEKERLAAQQRSILINTAKEKMKSNLLRAISHDLRTPLTGISCSSSAILESGDSLDKETHDKLVSNICTDSQWLIRMVENLLSVTKISDDTAQVKKSMEAAEEIVAEAVGRVKAQFPNQEIHVRVPEELIMVPMDGTLIEQVIINLVENAIKHAGKQCVIYVNVSTQEQNAVFTVKDDGNGIAPEEMPYLFEDYCLKQSASSDASRGIGIGLSICMSIIKAHGGTLTAKNGQCGGAVFQFILPMEGGY